MYDSSPKLSGEPVEEGGEAPGLGTMEKVLRSECVPQIHVLMVSVGTVWEGD